MSIIVIGSLSIIVDIAVFMFPLESVGLMIVFEGIARAVLGVIFAIPAKMSP